MIIVGVLILSSFGFISGCNFSITIEQSLRMDGFHRNMTYDVNIIINEETAWPYSDCLIGLHQPIPAGIYANPDELSDLKRSHRLNAITKNTNIELPAELSHPNIVYSVIKATNKQFHTWIPLHARYHKAIESGGYVVNEIEAPKLYMRCPDKKLDNCKYPLTPAKFLCAGESKKKCDWKELPVIVTTKTPTQWSVPVGDLNHYVPVALTTAAVVVLGSMYLLITIHYN